MSGLSCIYRGTVRHRRYTPRANSFNYSLFMLYLDLDELPGLFDPYRFWSARGRALACFRRGDYLFKPDLDLAEEVRQIVQRETGHRPGGPVRMLTHLRYFGYCFNPITLYYCFSSDGSMVEHILAEVRNTPWNERHCYVLSVSEDEAPRGKFAFRHAKSFHVSPFMKMDMEYAWNVTAPAESLVVHIENMRDGEPCFDATLTMHRQPVTQANLDRALLAHPFMTLKVILLIYYQGLKLWLKRIPFVPHPGHTKT
ncbi:MAG TPA: DUF1365 domain-containing protein [Gammaproteobacteria bacterium]|nr:DUF1365 domain-containing protein [Gammaproteobacteria bacterium]